MLSRTVLWQIDEQLQAILVAGHSFIQLMTRKYESTQLSKLWTLKIEGTLARMVDHVVSESQLKLARMGGQAVQFEKLIP